VKQLALVVLLALVAGCGGRDQANDRAFHDAVQAADAGAEVTFDGTVLAAPERNGDHERLRVRAPTGEAVEIDHNVSLAAWVPARQGDHVVVHGELYIDPERVGVHCTHALTSSGCPQPGWIELDGKYYE
jgi:hypothetical protein